MDNRRIILGNLAAEISRLKFLSDLELVDVQHYRETKNWTAYRTSWETINAYQKKMHEKTEQLAEWREKGIPKHVLQTGPLRKLTGPEISQIVSDSPSRRMMTKTASARNTRVVWGDTPVDWKEFRSTWDDDPWNKRVKRTRNKRDEASGSDEEDAF